jgi:3-oxoacyl-[acyl-carrier-protein] synthase II
LFGEDAYRSTSAATKSMTGHLLGGLALWKGSPAIMALVKGIIVPPTINHFTDDPEIDPKLNFTFNTAQKRDRERRA